MVKMRIKVRSYWNSDAMCDLVPFVQFKTCEQHHGGVLLLKVAGWNLKLY